MTAPEVVPCGHCGRPLTDPDSRALGYGPVCAAGVLGLDTHRTPVPRPRRRKDVDQIPLPLENPVDQKPEPYTVTLEYTTYVTFKVDADSPQDAHSEAVDGFMYGDIRPDTTEADSPELTKLERGGREVEFDSHVDLYGPKDKNGLSPWKYVAREHSSQIATGHDLNQVIADAFAAQEEA